MSKFAKGQQVSWDLGNGEAKGTIRDRFDRKVARRIRGHVVTRYGSPENPAYLITRHDGAEVLMFGSELRRG